MGPFGFLGYALRLTIARQQRKLPAVNARETRLVQLAMKGRIITPVSPEEVEAGSWTEFSDNWSGGCAKEPWDHIFIQAKPSAAYSVFLAVFEHDPQDVSCSCCGPAYSIHQAGEIDFGKSFFIKAADIEPEWVIKDPTVYSSESALDKEALGGFAKQLAKLSALNPLGEMTAALLSMGKEYQFKPIASIHDEHLVYVPIDFDHEVAAYPVHYVPTPFKTSGLCPTTPLKKKS